MSIDLNLAETRYFREGDGYVSVGVEPFADNPLTFYDPWERFSPGAVGSSRQARTRTEVPATS